MNSFISKTTIPKALIGIAGVHYVTAELSRGGLVALPTRRNTAGYDIFVATPDGGKHANTQVKTSQKKVTFWQMPPVDKIHARSKDYYVLVRWLPKDKKFEGFMLKGREARAEAARHKARSKRAGKRILPISFVWIDKKARGAEVRWKRGWEDWQFSAKLCATTPATIPV
jgi:hypothetical protein